jgi:hypothetical protein
MSPPIRTINLGALGQSRDQAPLPMPNGALYRHPNPDGSRKNCGNCVLWVSGEDRCVIHPKELHIDSDELCGYHVYGKAMSSWVDLPGIMPVSPELSGLRMVGPGGACASCKFYRRQDETHGICIGVSNPDTRKPGVPVESRGWCARYEGM